MADRNICCESCSTNLGTIRDARLRKDIRYFCNDCDVKRNRQIRELTSILATYKATGRGNQPPLDRDFTDLFGDLFR